MVRRAESATKSVSYRGKKVATVYFGGKHTTSTLRVVHKNSGKTRTDFYTPRAIAGIVVIQDGAKVWRYSPSHNLWEEGPTLKKDTADGLNPDLMKNYVFSFRARAASLVDRPM